MCFIYTHPHHLKSWNAQKRGVVENAKICKTDGVEMARVHQYALVGVAMPRDLDHIVRVAAFWCDFVEGHAGQAVILIDPYTFLCGVAIGWRFVVDRYARYATRLSEMTIQCVGHCGDVSWVHRHSNTRRRSGDGDCGHGHVCVCVCTYTHTYILSLC